MSRPTVFLKLPTKSMTRTTLGLTSHDLHEPHDVRPLTIRAHGKLQLTRSILTTSDKLYACLPVHARETTRNRDGIWSSAHSPEQIYLVRARRNSVAYGIAVVQCSIMVGTSGVSPCDQKFKTTRRLRFLTPISGSIGPQESQKWGWVLGSLVQTYQNTKNGNSV